VCYHLGGDVEPKNLSVKFTLIIESWLTPPRGLPLDTYKCQFYTYKCQVQQDLARIKCSVDT
jgi:hypothetical protein